MHNPRGRDPANPPSPGSSPRAAPSSFSTGGKNQESPPAPPGHLGPAAPSPSRENGAHLAKLQNNKITPSPPSQRPAPLPAPPRPLSLCAGATPRAVFPRGKAGAVPAEASSPCGAHLVDVVAHSLPEPLQVHPRSVPPAPLPIRAAPAPRAARRCSAQTRPPPSLAPSRKQRPERGVPGALRPPGASPSAGPASTPAK